MKNSKIINLAFYICYYYIMMHLTRYANVARYIGLVDNDGNTGNTNRSDYDTYQSKLLKTIKKLRNHIVTTTSGGSIGIGSMSFDNDRSLEDNLMRAVRDDLSELNVSNLKIVD